MTTKTKKINKNVARSPRTRNERGANAEQIRFAFVPILREFRGHTKKNEARLWIPIETSLLVRYEFASCSIQTRYIFVAILLYCGANGIEEIPLDAKFMASVLVADERTIARSFDELIFKNLLQERKKEREEKKEKEQTDRQESAGARVSADSEIFSFSEVDSVEKNLPNSEVKKTVDKNNSASTSQFSLDDCKKYVEKEIEDGATIQNPSALAMKLFNTGQADSFIKQKLYPKEFEKETFGEPRQFSDEPCAVCFGAKLADADGKGFRPCENCKNEKGVSVGWQPIQ